VQPNFLLFDLTEEMCQELATLSVKDSLRPCVFRQAWAKMIDVEGGMNPLIKDTALDSKGSSSKFQLELYSSTMKCTW
jgi:hypothetical protein